MIYIAGKIEGLPYEVAETKFKTTEIELRSMGAETINPMEQGLKHMKYEDQMAQCFKMIRLHATAIFLHRDWAKSNGARREFELVCELNKSHHRRILIYFEESEGYFDVRRDLQDKILKGTEFNYYQKR